MQSNVTRRNFLQTSGVTASALVMTSAKVVSANDAVNVAFIGLGGRGRTLLKQVLRIPDFNIVALCDLREDQLGRAMAICEEDDVTPKTYEDFRVMMENENLDACIVATEVGRHAEVVIPVLEYGLHCFSEKPVESTVEKVDAITRVARTSKGIYQVGFQRRYNPTFHKTVAAAQDSSYGMLRAMHGHWHFSGGMGNGGWVRNVDMSGGKLVEQACHHMDVFTWVMNDHPVSCQASGRTTFPHETYPENVSEDISALTFQFRDGAFLAYTHCALLPPQFNNEKMWIIREKALVDLPKGVVYERDSHRDGEMKTIADETDYYYGTFQQFEHFAKHLRADETPWSNIETARTSTLTAMLGHKAMYNRTTREYEPSMVKWEELGTKTDFS